MKIIATTVFLTVALLASAASAGPVEVVNEKYAAIKVLIGKKLDRAAFDKAVKTELDTFVDYNELSKRTLGDRWAGMKQKDRDRFVAGFKQMIQRGYVKKFNPDAQFTMEITPAATSADDGSVIVASTIRSGSSEAGVSYAFHQVKGRWWAFDVIIDEVSMMKNYRRQFAKIWDAEGFEGLMKKIDKKNSEAAAQ